MTGVTCDVITVMRYPWIVITVMRHHGIAITVVCYPCVTITPYSMRYVEVSLTIDVSTARMVANHRKWGLSVPYSGWRTVSHNLANV